MDKRQLGNSDLHLSAIGFGAWAIGGGEWAFAWGPQDDNDSVAAIHKALDLGVNWIDTAAVYGLGHSEEVVAKAVKSASSKPYIFTKCARVWNEKREIGKSLKQIRREAEDSLRRLQVEAIDLYQVHWPEPDEEIEEGWAVMADLQREGKVRWIGVSNFSVSQMERAAKIAPITSNQPPYSMLNRAAEAEILPFCKKNNIGVINYAPMHSGMLTGAMSKERVAAFPQDDFRRTTRSLCCRATWPSLTSSRRSGRATTSPRESSPSRGRCIIRRSPQRLWVGATPDRWREHFPPLPSG
jgi:aryl-alcohol dehydrogenase-like predicted oxidoreductase